MPKEKSIKKSEPSNMETDKYTEQSNEVKKVHPVRIDQLLVRLGHAQSRERAKALIKAGSVLINEKLITKVSTRCALDAVIKMKSKDIPWVSRAGLKLEKALDVWLINVANAVCLDIGASMGGFTEVLLHRGAKKVYSLDVGHNQLAQQLRENSGVIVMEGKNIREATSEWFNEPIDIITVDVSHISLRHILPKVSELLRDNGEAVVLIKPQFEVGKNRTQKGIVRSPSLHKEVINTVKILAIKEGFTPVDIIESPIEGVRGNKEFLFHLKK